MSATVKLIERRAEVRKSAAGIRVVIANEEPMQRFDKQEGELVDEILSLSGIQWRQNVKSLPLVDCGVRSSIDRVLGSVKRIQVDSGELVGWVLFADDQFSRETKQKVADGHLTELRVTAAPLESLKVNRGQRYSCHGREITGPSVVVTKWRPIDVSIWV